MGEADRIITLLTYQHGKIRAVAKGVRRTKSRFGARLEPFMRDQLLIAQGRNLDIVSQAVTIASYSDAISSQYDAYLAAGVIVEFADKLISSESEAVPQQYRLLVGALASLAKKQHPPQTIVLSYLLRSLQLAGWSPSLSSCVICGRHDDLQWFSVSLGGMVCSHDYSGGCQKISYSDTKILFALLTGNWEDCPPIINPEIESLVEEWTQFYLERPLRSLSLIHS